MTIPQDWDNEELLDAVLLSSHTLGRFPADPKAKQNQETWTAELKRRLKKVGWLESEAEEPGSYSCEAYQDGYAIFGPDGKRLPGWAVVKSLNIVFSRENQAGYMAYLNSRLTAALEGKADE